MLSWSKRSVLLFDFENIVRPPDNSFVAKLANWVAWLESGAFDEEEHRPRKLIAKRVYWNAHCEGNRPIFERHGFDAFACPAAAKDKKSAADIWIALDAIDMLDEYSRVEEVIILSTDTDFVPVVNRLREKKRDVVVVVNEANVSATVYPLHADAVIPLSALGRATSYVKPKRGWFGAKPAVSAPAPAIETPPALEVVVAEVVNAPPAVKALPAPARAPRARTPAPVAAPVFDLESAADFVVNAAMAQPTFYISRETVRNVLRGVPGFSTSGKHPWLGCGNYCNMLAVLASLRPGQLEHTKYQGGGCAIRARRAPKTPS